MRRIVRDDKGSITIEMCLVMPIVIGVVMMLILLILRGLNEGVALGTSQVMVYEYSASEKNMEGDLEKLQNAMMMAQVQGSLKVRDDEISVTVGSDKEGINSISTVGCAREWELCTDRLRRWQLYGDVLCE